MRTSMAYFAGAGTVVVAIAAGLGGGVLISSVVDSHSSSKEMTKLEQRMSSKPIPVSNAPSEPVSYLMAIQPAASGPVTVVPAGHNPPQNETTNAAAPQPKPAEVSAANSSAANAAPANAPQQPASVTQAATSEQAKPEDPRRDVDVKREVKRDDRWKAERRQQWTERRRYRQDQELRDVELKVREETEPRRAFAAEPARLEMPRIKLFGEDD
jgi:hypothetical protein